MIFAQMWLACWLEWLRWIELANRAAIVLPFEPIDPRPSATITNLAQWRIDHPRDAA